MKLKFKYGQQVSVIDGFYNGQRGTVIEYGTKFWIVNYKVDLKNIGSKWFKESILELCGKPTDYESSTGI